MARTAKPLQPLDREIARVLSDAVERSGASRRELADTTGMSMNRIGIILRAEAPPASVGEIELIAQAVGLTASEVLRRGEAGDYALAALDRDDDEEAEAQQTEP